MTDSSKERIRELNDLCRKTLGATGHLTLKRGFWNLSADVKAAILERVATFDNFTPDNDPYGEHDFGSIRYQGYHVFWKLDYYAAGSNFRYGSEDPADPQQTARVLTVMLAEEY